MAPVHELSHVRRTSLESRFGSSFYRVPSVHAGLSLFAPSTLSLHGTGGCASCRDGD